MWVWYISFQLSAVIMAAALLLGDWRENEWLNYWCWFVIISGLIFCLMNLMRNNIFAFFNRGK